MLPAMPPERSEPRKNLGGWRLAVPGGTLPRVDSRDELPIERVLDREVDGLSGEVAQDVSPVAPPKGERAFFTPDASEAVGDA